MESDQFLISIGCALFYAGHENYVFNERFYEYKSQGVIKTEEPLNVFTHWHNYIIEPNRQKRDEKIGKCWPEGYQFLS